MKPILPQLSCGNPVPTLLLGPFFRAVPPLRAMEPGQPYQRDEALLGELGYKTGQKAMAVTDVTGILGMTFFYGRSGACLHLVALPNSQGFKIKDNQSR